MKKLQIVNMYQNNIVLKVQKNKLKHKTIVWSIVFCALIFSCSYYKIVGGMSADNWYDSVQSVYNPTSRLYSDEGNVIFTSNENILAHSGSFDLPIVSGDIRTSNGQILVTPSESILVVTPCPGLIEEVGKTNDGKKYIKIKHTTKIYSVIENVETIAVNKGDIVKRGDKIATASEGKTITISIYKNKKMLNDLRIENNKIVWG